MLTDMYRWGAGLAVTEQIRDVGQNVYFFFSKQEAVAAPVRPGTHYPHVT